MNRHPVAPRSTRALIPIGVVLLLAVVDVHIAQAQCAMCRQALQSPEGQALAAALRGGILLLLAAPFTVFAVIATLAIRRFRRPTDGPV